MTTLKPVEIVDSDGHVLPGEFRLREQASENPDQVRIDPHFLAEARTALGNSFFEALGVIRQILESRRLRPRCFGACRTVYPSPMSLSMGTGELAYHLELGRPARRKDLVSIFESNQDIDPVAVEEQTTFYQQWLESLK